MNSPKKAVLVALAGVLGGIAVFFLVTSIASSGEVEVNLGDDRFEVGDAERLANAIERDEQPLAFPDLLRKNRPIFLQHLGDSPEEGWLAFDAAVDACPLEWSVEQETFRDTCTDDVYPRDGEGLPHYPVTVEDGKVIVDLRG
jgi:hypothetical protein